MSKLVAFLGNPGSQFNGTRHNTGWGVLDKMIELGKINSSWQEKFHSKYCKVGETIFLKPLTYMNLSGTAVQEAAKFYAVKPEDIIIVHDDIELKFGEIKLQLGGGMGGHNGLRSVKQCLGTDKFQRLRVGVGRPEDNNCKMDVSSWVTAHFTDIENKCIQNIYEQACDLLV